MVLTSMEILFPPLIANGEPAFGSESESDGMPA
jgi:hypothetical protein